MPIFADVTISPNDLNVRKDCDFSLADGWPEGATIQSCTFALDTSGPFFVDPLITLTPVTLDTTGSVASVLIGGGTMGHGSRVVATAVYLEEDGVTQGTIQRGFWVKVRGNL